jgi:hypothetical protein
MPHYVRHDKVGPYFFLPESFLPESSFLPASSFLPEPVSAAGAAAADVSRSCSVLPLVAPLSLPLLVGGGDAAWPADAADLPVSPAEVEPVVPLEVPPEESLALSALLPLALSLGVVVTPAAREIWPESELAAGASEALGAGALAAVALALEGALGLSSASERTR